MKIYLIGCDSEFIEKTLFEQGRVIFLNHPDYGLINLQLVDDYDRNLYDKPLNYKGIAGSFDYNCNLNNSVIMQNNILNFPTIQFACYFADKISKIDRVYDVNLLRSKNTCYF